MILILTNRGEGGGFQKEKNISAKFTKLIITINVPVVYMAWDIMIYNTR
jgi:hypothetical protein